LGREIPARNRRDPYVSAEDVRQDRPAARPFVDELRPRTVPHSEGMGPRVTAHDMTSSRELAQILLVNESASADVIRRDEEISPELVTLQHFRCTQRAHASVIERDRE